MLQDPLNDAMATIRNAEAVGKGECLIRPASKLIGRVLDVMKEADYISAYERVEDGRGGVYRIVLKGNINDCGVIKPRYSITTAEFEKWESRYLPAQDFGALIMTTTEGVVTHATAKERRTGGKLLAYVY